MSASNEILELLAEMILALEGNGQGGLPGFNLTQTERIQQYESLNGNIVPKGMQDVQGGFLKSLSHPTKSTRGILI
jgi:hypothetical protein